MSCHEFTSVSVELARGQLIDAAQRESARAHADACAACAERLRRERALTSALRGVGASMRDVQAPARVEAALLEAVRARRAGRHAAEVAEAFSAGRGASINSPAAISRLFAPRVRRALFAAAIAASLILFAALAWRAVSRRATTTHGEIARGATSVNESAAVDHSSADVDHSSAAVDQSSAGVDHSGRDRDGVGVAFGTGRVSRASKSTARRSSSTRAGGAAEVLPISFREDGGSVTAERLPPASAAGTGAAEMASTADFMPLGAAVDRAPLDGGQMVRVEVPRAALAALGLPVNGARAGENVRADVLLAHDGTARAIRLLP